MKAINLSPKEPIDIRLTINGAVYFLRAFSYGAFDVYGRDRTGAIIALGSVGMDGIGASAALGSRLGRFLGDHGGNVYD